MANVLRALDTSNAWSSDDSDEETHFREMVQLSIQARRLEPKGTGDDAVSEDAANDRVARDTVLDSSDDDAVEDDAVEDDAVEDDDADARGDSEDHLSRGDGDDSVDSPIRRLNPSASSRRFPTMHRKNNTRSVTETLASMSAAPAMEPAAPELVAALAALGIDVADGRKKGTTAKGTNGDEGLGLKGSLSSPFGSFSVPNESRDRSATFTLPVRTGGGYDVRGFRAPEFKKRSEKKSARPTESRPPASRPPAARRATPFRATRDVAGVLNLKPKHRSTSHERRLEIYKQEVVCLGRLTDAEHYGYWAHAWWSDDDADAVASAMSTAPVPPTPFPVGFVIRTVLRETEKTKPSGGKENVRRFGGRVAARGGADFDLDAAGIERSAVECSVRERRAGRPWEGPEFVIRWLGADVSSAECGVRKREKKRAFAGSSTNAGGGFFSGATPKAAFAEFARALQRREAFRAPPARARLPDAEALFGFSSRAVTDALAEHAAAAGRAVARLRAPHGVGLATLRVDALDREFDPDSSNRLEKTNEKTFVAEWRSSRGAFPLLPGYRVTFALCAGTAAACEVVRSNETPGGVAFAVTVRDGGAVAKRVRSRCPDRAWAKLKAERRVLIFSGALDARLALDRTEAFLGAHLFGFESPTVARMTAQSEAAAAAGDAFLLAEPFLRDVYGARASGKEKESQRKRVTAEYL